MTLTELKAKATASELTLIEKVESLIAPGVVASTRHKAIIFIEKKNDER